MNVNFQAEASKQGRIGEDLAEIRLRDAGFTITDKRTHLRGVEIDIVAENRHGIAFFFSVKASWRGDRQGLKRTDTLKKAIAEAYIFRLLDNGSPFVVITSHKPSSGIGLEMLKMIPRELFFDVILLTNDSKRLRWFANATERDLENDLKRHRQMSLFD